MARTPTSAVLRVPGLLRTALLLLLLVTSCRHAAGAPAANELRCQCVKTAQGVHPKLIQSVKVTAPGPFCDQTEVIVTLKNGQAVCLNPEAPQVKNMIERILKKDSSN